MMNFNKLNDEANYYSELSGKTGSNCWNQDKFQSGVIDMIEDLNLSKEQIEKLGNLMIANNAALDMEPSQNKSVTEFEVFAKNKVDTLEQNISMSKVA